MCHPMVKKSPNVVCMLKNTYMLADQISISDSQLLKKTRIREMFG